MSDRPAAELLACDCADVPPTMPTCRIEHLADCPVAFMIAFADTEARARDHAELRAMVKRGDDAGIATFVSRDSKARAEAQVLRKAARLMPDRPAAELLAEWRRAINDDGLSPEQWRMYHMESLLVRLARAEQALAGIEKLCNEAEETYTFLDFQAIRTALNATQDE